MSHFPRVCTLLIGLFVAAASVGAAADLGKGSLTGKVVDDHGKAIAGARVMVEGAANAEGTTDAHGEFRIELEPGEYRIQIEAEGHDTAALRDKLLVEAGKETKLHRRVELPASDRGSVVRGSVFTETGTSIVGATVVIERIPFDDGKQVVSFRKEAASDSMGLFAFHLPEGEGRYKISATHPRYASSTVTVDVAGAEVLNAPPLKMASLP